MLGGHQQKQPIDGELALLYIEISQGGSISLQRAARRINHNVRQTDSVLLLDLVCAVVLPGTSLAGGQAVARRLTSLLVDIEYELQILSGAAAQTLLQRLQAERAIQVGREMEVLALPSVEEPVRQADTLPYLAFLSNYPSHRLLHLFPFELAARYQCIPVGAERNMLTIATHRRLEQEVIAHFQQVTQHLIFQVRCESTVIEDVLQYWQRILPVKTYLSTLVEVGESLT